MAAIIVASVVLGAAARYGSGVDALTAQPGPTFPLWSSGGRPG